MPEEMTNLSSLKAGKDYKMEADGVCCTIHVVREGISPMCIVYGGTAAPEQTSIAQPIVMQLVGWLEFDLADGDEATMIQNFVHFDERPSNAWLIGAWYNAGNFVIAKIACQPDITEL